MPLEDTINEVIADIERYREQDKALIEESRPIHNIIAGAGKTIAGGVGGPFEAVGRMVPLVPKGVGEIIGAVEETPYTDWKKNVSLKLAQEGVGQARQGVMGIFGLKEPPNVYPVSQATRTALSTPSAPTEKPSTPAPTVKPTPETSTAKKEVVQKAKGGVGTKTPELNKPLTEEVMVPDYTRLLDVLKTAGVSDKAIKILTQPHRNWVKDPSGLTADWSQRVSNVSDWNKISDVLGNWEDFKKITREIPRGVPVPEGEIGGAEGVEVLSGSGYSNRPEWHKKPGGVARGLALENLRQAVKTAGSPMPQPGAIWEGRKVVREEVPARDSDAVRKAAEALRLIEAGGVKREEVLAGVAGAGVGKTKAETRKIGLEANEIQNDIDSTDLTKSKNVAELVLRWSPTIKIYDSITKEVIGETQDIATGIRVMEAFGVKITDKAKALMEAMRRPRKGDEKTLSSGRTAVFNGKKWVLKE